MKNLNVFGVSYACNWPIESTDNHEGLVLKHPGRPKPDIDDNGLDKFVRLRFISMFNVKTLLASAKKEELAHEAQL